MPIQILRPDKDLIDVRVDNQATVGNIRAVKRRPGWIRTVDNTIGVMGISFSHWIFPLRCRILFGGVLRSDWRFDNGPTNALFRNFARVRSLVWLLITLAFLHLSHGRVRQD